MDGEHEWSEEASCPSSSSGSGQSRTNVVDVSETIKLAASTCAETRQTQPDVFPRMCGAALCGPVPLYTQRAGPITIWSDGDQKNRVHGLWELIAQEEKDQQEDGMEEEVPILSVSP
jgi:hypothetical protein